MYKYASGQIRFEDFGQPVGMHMSSNNRWVKRAESIPWDEIEYRYAGLFKNRKGNVAKPLRLVLGACMPEILREINELVIRKAKKESEEERHDNRDDSGEPQPPQNNGTMIVDATCAPSNIKYPQDLIGCFSHVPSKISLCSVDIIYNLFIPRCKMNVQQKGEVPETKRW